MNAELAFKQALRLELKAQRAALAPAAGSDAAIEFGSRVAQLLPEHALRGRAVAVYWALGHELDPLPIAAAVRARGGCISYPRVAGRRPPDLRFCPVDDEGQLQPGPFGTREPPASAAEVAALDVVFVPGLGFDRVGHRLGYGQGYYDRALRARPAALRVAVCYPFQVRASIPHDPHDEPMDLIATPDGVLLTGARPQRFTKEAIE